MKKSNIILIIIFSALLVAGTVFAFLNVSPSKALLDKYFPTLNTSSHPGNYTTIYPGQISNGEIKDWIQEEEYEKLDFVFEDTYGRFFNYQEKIKNNLLEIDELLASPDFKVYYLISEPTKFCKEFIKEIDESERSQALKNYLSEKEIGENIVEIGTLIHPYRIVDKQIHFPISRLFKGSNQKYYYLMK